MDDKSINQSIKNEKTFILVIEFTSHLSKQIQVFFYINPSLFGRSNIQLGKCLHVNVIYIIISAYS